MLIKTKLYAIGGFLCVILIAISVVAMYSFDGLSQRFEQVVLGSNSSASSAEKATQGSASGSEQLGAVNAEMLGIVDGIQQANQRTKLVSKKVDDIALTLTELIDTIDELSEDVVDEEAISILEEVSDEISDISERLQREALVNIVESAKTLDRFSGQISQQASNVSQLDEFLRQQVKVSQSTMESSAEIKTLATQASQDVEWQKTTIVSSLVALAVITMLSVFFMVKVIVYPINKTVKLMEDIGDGEGDLTQRLEVGSKDEMALIAGAFNRFVERIQGLILEVSARPVSCNKPLIKPCKRCKRVMWRCRNNSRK